MQDNDLTAAINTVVETFIRDITALAGKAAMQLVESSFASPGTQPSARGGTARPAKQATSNAKRTAEDLDGLCDKFAGFVAKNPGLRIEQINKQLGTSTKDLALPIRKLLANGRVKAKGQKRSTTYHPGKSK